MPPNRSQELHAALLEHRKLQTDICEGRKSPRLMVFSCKPGKCPGLADGVRGITLAYVLAVITKRAFAIHAPTWVPLEEFFPAAFPFQLEQCEVFDNAETKQEIMANVITYTIPKDPDCNKWEKFGFLSSPGKVVAIFSNQASECGYALLRHAGINIDERVHQSLARIVFELLFNFPMNNLRRRVDSFLESNSIFLDRTVCIHVRSGSFTAKFDGFCHFQRNIDDVWRCARAMELSTEELRRQSEITWLVTGDNDLHKPMAEDYLRSCAVNDALFAGQRKNRVVVSTADFGSLNHARVENQPKSNLERVFFDLHLMSQCPYLVASYSGFSGLAAALNLDWAQRKFFRVDRRERPTQNMNEVCRRQMNY